MKTPDDIYIVRSVDTKYLTDNEAVEKDVLDMCPVDMVTHMFVEEADERHMVGTMTRSNVTGSNEYNSFIFGAYAIPRRVITDSWALTSNGDRAEVDHPAYVRWYDHCRFSLDWHDHEDIDHLAKHADDVCIVETVGYLRKITDNYLTVFARRSTTSPVSYHGVLCIPWRAVDVALKLERKES